MASPATAESHTSHSTSNPRAYWLLWAVPILDKRIKWMGWENMVVCLKARPDFLLLPGFEADAPPCLATTRTMTTDTSGAWSSLHEHFTPTYKVHLQAAEVPITSVTPRWSGVAEVERTLSVVLKARAFSVFDTVKGAHSCIHRRVLPHSRYRALRAA